jgi:hypothetical protein
LKIKPLEEEIQGWLGLQFVSPKCCVSVVFELKVPKAIDLLLLCLVAAMPPYSSCFDSEPSI